MNTQERQQLSFFLRNFSKFDFNILFCRTLLSLSLQEEKKASVNGESWRMGLWLNNDDERIYHDKDRPGVSYCIVE